MKKQPKLKVPAKYLKQCMKSDGRGICPICGSTDVCDWEKSPSHFGAGCGNPKCPTEGESWICVAKYKPNGDRTIVDIELPDHLYE